LVDQALSPVTLRGPQSLYDSLFRVATFSFAGLVLVILGAIILSLIVGGAPALSAFGPAFLFTSVWDPNALKFGALVPIYGTLVTSAIAMLIGVPLSFGVAVFVTELCPPMLKRPISITVELLAGIPSIIYGMWGLFIFAPFMKRYIEPFLIGSLGQVPVLGALFGRPAVGVGILTAGIVLAIMILPFISSIMRDVFETVPPMLKESAYGLGCTTWEVIWNIVVPFTRRGVVGGIMLGLGRAMGETMAVTFVIGNAQRYNVSLLAPGQTISSSLANEFAEATDQIYSSSLIALGLVLFIITFIVLALAKTMLLHMQRQSGV